MIRFMVVLVALFGMVAAAPAQEHWPSHPVTLIVPYPPGTAPDTIARMVGDQLSARIGQPVVIENRTGAGGLIGTEAAAKAKNDGYTLFLGSLDTQAIIGHLYHPKFDPVTAFAPISLLGRISNVIVGSPKLKVNSIQELIAAGKKGQSFTFGSPGVGTNLHLIGELLKLKTGINLVHVPYRVSSTSYTDAIGGRIDLVVSGLPPVAGLLKEKKLKALVTTAPHRIAALPDMPTMAEIGLKDLTITGWFGLLAPAGTNATILTKLNTDIKTIAQNEAYRKKMQEMLIDPVSTTPEEFGSLIKAESARMGEVIEKAHITVK